MHTTTVLAVKAPAEYSSVERQEFAALVKVGGEVEAKGLEGRIESAHALLYLREASCLVGIAALKEPNTTYRESVFEKACATQIHKEYPLELGWVFVVPSARGKGHSKALVQAAVAYAGKSRIFATSRTDNVHMHASLLGASFVKNGTDYASKIGMHQLSLFLRDMPAN